MRLTEVYMPLFLANGLGVGALVSFFAGNHRYTFWIAALLAFIGLLISVFLVWHRRYGNTAMSFPSR